MESKLLHEVESHDEALDDDEDDDDEDAITESDNKSHENAALNGLVITEKDIEQFKEPGMVSPASAKCQCYF